MDSLVLDALIFALFPVIVLIISGSVASFRTPSTSLRRSTRFFAAGVIFYVVIAKLFPIVIIQQGFLRIIVILVAGIGLMFGVRWLTRKLGQAGEHGSQWPTVKIANVLVDLLIIGFLVGIGFVIGGKELLVLTIGLTLEVLSLSLDVSVALASSGTTRAKSLITVIMLALPLMAGAISGLVFALFAATGQALAHGSSGPVLETVFTLGIAGLMFFLIEEFRIENGQRLKTN